MAQSEDSLTHERVSREMRDCREREFLKITNIFVYISLMFLNNSSHGENMSDNKDKSFGIDDSFKLITILLTSIGIVIYCYSLGYFEQMGIPGYPSFQGSIYFFFKNLVGFSTDAIPTRIGLGLLFLSLISAQFISLSAEKSTCSYWIKLLAIVVATIVGLILVPVAAPVFIMIFASGIAIRFMLDKNESSNFNSPQNYLGYISLLCLCCVWSFNSFSASDLLRKKDLNDYFSRGTVLSVANTSSWLIWSDESVFYWAHCGDMRSYIYGTKDMEKPFIKIQMGDDISPLFCNFK